MQYFQDTVSSKIYAFEPDVAITSTGGVYSFRAAAGTPLNVPTTLQPCPGNAPPAPPAPTLSQQATAMLAAGIQIVSSANPGALSGTYPCDQITLNDDSNILAALAGGLSLPNGVAIRLDTSGNPHSFSAVDFKNLCQAKLNFTLALNTIIGSNSGTLPSQPVTIA